MTETYGIYKCNVCGNIVEVAHASSGTLVCCGQPMQLMKPKKTEEGSEKHLPVAEKNNKEIKINIGSVPHPMEEKHHIEWVEIINDDKSCRQFLHPGMKPEAGFCTEEKKARARAYCNIHGLWEADV